MSAILSRNFRLSIPRPICQAQGWKAGQELVFIPKGKGILVMPAPELGALAGIAGGAHGSYRDRDDRY
jgi:hypothetical protein